MDIQMDEPLQAERTIFVIPFLFMSFNGTIQMMWYKKVDTPFSGIGYIIRGIRPHGKPTNK
ncbi:hypothetical protein [Eubacterium sp. 14-2]|uniref:hypothetical protein n=1 Tax=Eubacterium sp. 14-2 TaxID=1235790 RepID=UPI0012DE888B|nr:hypothetical protein [Eubacterium sp. 14-2]